MKHWPFAVLHCGEEFDECWKRNREDPLLFVAGGGFDPRASAVLERLASVTSRQIDLLLIELPDASTDLEVRPLAEQNRTRLTELATQTGGSAQEQAIPEHADAGSLGRLISRAFQRSQILDSYSEVVVDVSAMPRSVFFPLLRGILERAHVSPDDGGTWQGDLHVAVCENAEIDSAILEEGTSPMAPIGGFAGPAPTDGEEGTVIWIPVLGEGQLARVERLNAELAHNEVCPVLPFPAEDPRRADRLLVEYRELLFEEIRIEPRNVIHAHERNPFDLYRTLDRLYARYSRALNPLGEVSLVLSAHSSKLLSVGVLLTAYEHELGVQDVSPTLYALREDVDMAACRERDDLVDVWLTGGPFQP